jgi:hypothetical protein
MVLFKITLFFKRIRVIDVVTARARTERKAIMKTFTIDENNNITVFGGKEEAAGTSGLVFSARRNWRSSPRSGRLAASSKSGTGLLAWPRLAN